MRNPLKNWCLLALLMLPLATSNVWGQTFTGGLRGAVKDSGGVIPGATVSITNESNGQVRETVSNEQGQYDFTAVPPGVYTVKASLTGFKSWARADSWKGGAGTSQMRICCSRVLGSL